MSHDTRVDLSVARLYFMSPDWGNGQSTRVGLGRSITFCCKGFSDLPGLASRADSDGDTDESQLRGMASDRHPLCSS